jgi:hypothetical protein
MSFTTVAHGKRKAISRSNRMNEDRHEVVAHVELHARVLERLEAALVGRELLRVRPARPDQLAERHRHHADGEADEDEEEDGKVLSKH